MRAWSVALLLTLAVPCLAQTQPAPKTVKVKVEAAELDKAMLLRKLNEHGPDHGLKFELADKGYEYRITFSTRQEPAGLYQLPSSEAQVVVYDPKGAELFAFNRAARMTDTGASNAVAKEIIKRLLRWWKTPEGRKEAPTQ